MRLLVWGLVAGGVLAGSYVATRSTQSALVALGGIFVAAQLIGPVLVDWRRIAAAREAPSARPLLRRRMNGRRGTGAVAWVRLDLNRNPALTPVPTGGDGVSMPLALSARRTS